MHCDRGGDGGGRAAVGAGDRLVTSQGTVLALDPATGVTLWTYRPDTPFGGNRGIGIGNGLLFAGQLGGSLGPAPAPEPPPVVLRWSGRVDDTATVQPGAVTVFNIQSAGRRDKWRNDYGVSPSRTRVVVGALLTFTNTTAMTHTITARDGSWTSGPIAPGGKATVTVTRPGPYEYRCLEHPWSMGELTVAK